MIERGRSRRAYHYVIALSLVTSSWGCGRASDASVVLSLDGFADSEVDGFRDARAALEIRRPNGKHATATVRGIEDDEEQELVVTSPIPMRCDDGACELTVSLDPGEYRFALHLYARDRCDSESQVLTMRVEDDGLVELPAGESTPILLEDVNYSFDDDDDGIANVLEARVCGRFDVRDTDAWPTSCDKASSCCDVSAGEAWSGRMAFFAAVDDYLDRHGQSRTGGGFYLDATEVTTRAYKRCVAAGGCLFGQPDHPLRQELAQRAGDRPMIGVTPREAQEFCLWAGKRLPLDDEWDFAAAYRDGGLRGRFPWDNTTSSQRPDQSDGRAGHSAIDASPIACRPTATSIAANHRAAGQDCPLSLAAVGSYPSSAVHRGEGAIAFDMAGNAMEWTLSTQTTPSEANVDDETRVTPAATPGVHLRGGGFDSISHLLENDFAVSLVEAADTDNRDPDSDYYQDIQRLSALAGFRCASPTDTFVPEPLCPAQ